MGAPQPALSPSDPVCPVWRLPRVGLLHPPLFLLLETGQGVGAESERVCGDPQRYRDLDAATRFRASHGNRLHSKLWDAELFRKIK